MKESYEKGLANRSAPNPTLMRVTSWVWHGQGVHAGQPLSSEITSSACRPCPVLGKATSSEPTMARPGRTRRSRRPCACVETPDARTGRSHRFPGRCCVRGRSENLTEGTADMHADGKSHGSIVPTKWANKAGTPVAESAEERESPKGNDVMVALVPDTESDFASTITAKHLRHVGMATSRPSLPKGGAV